MKLIKLIIIIIFCAASFFIGYKTGSENLNNYRKEMLEENSNYDTNIITIDSIPNNIQILHNKNTFNKVGAVENVIPNEKVAISVFLPIARNIYGNKRIASEIPFVIDLDDDSIWSITGTCHYQSGGVVHARILSTNGKILEIYHEK